ncbi:MAG TPA: M56 family metallopeptidase [Terracidiphilus sp.]|jgi:TonB family protein
MNGLAPLLLSYLVNSLWQIPLIVLVAWIAARVLRPMGPAAEHRAWVTALVLEVAMPALSLADWHRLHLAWPWQAHAAQAVDGTVSVAMGAGTAFAALRLPDAIAVVLMIAYLTVTAYCLARFVWHWIRLSVLSRSVDPVPGGDPAFRWERWKQPFEAGRVALASSKEVFAPVTMGILTRRVLLPEGLIHRLSQCDLDTAIAHELAHIRRNDFLKNLLYEIASLPMSYHPGAWFTCQQLTETREMVCDEMAAGDAGNHAYAQSLLRLASLLLDGKPVRVPHAIGVFDSNTLERRLMKLTETKKKIGRTRRVILACACVVLGVATAGSALALRLAVDATGNSPASHKKVISVPPEQMQTMIVKKVTPVYPPEAKKARIQGTVELNATIGKTGHVENLKVKSGPNELQQSSIDAVRQWVYKPFLLNGDPIEVQTTISVVYSLQK